MSPSMKTEPAAKAEPKPRRRLSFLMLLILFLILIFLYASGALFLLGSTGGANPELGLIKAAYLHFNLLRNQTQLNEPADSFAGTTIFTLESGTSAQSLAQDLEGRGIITDAGLFSDYLAFYGLDRDLEAGVYELSPAMSIPVIARKFSTGDTAQVVIRVNEGWRREQIAEAVDQLPSLSFTGGDFLHATAQGAVVPEEFFLSGDLPEGATLEGFLYPDTYILPITATANDLVSLMLNNYLSNVTEAMRRDAAERGWSMYQIVTLASVVEREVIYSDEAPEVASVFYNRLADGMKLESCPTVQYVLGYSQAELSWWPADLTLEQYTTSDSPFNTYLYPGLPPAPIANPGIDSIKAAIYPETTPYFFFRAACDGSGKHNFAITYEEHLANACE